MATFKQLETVITLKKGDRQIQIVKFQKEGTKRVFFTPMYAGKHITTIMFARMYSARSFAKDILKKIA